MAEQQDDMGKTLKRRGILAAAGAVVMGIVAKQASQPVAADGDPIVTGGHYSAAGTTSIINTASAPALALTSANTLGALQAHMTGDNDPAVSGFSDDGLGAGIAGASKSTGPIPANLGVYGTSGLASGTGVHGACNLAFGIGTKGESSSYFGVQGFTDTGIGIVGDVKAGGAGTSNIGVLGRVGASVANNQSNTVGVYGQNLATGAGGIGMMGIVNAGSAGGTIGISGSNQSSGVNSHGIVGVATVGHGLVGTTNYAGAAPPYYAGLVGNATHGAYAGLFFGNVQVNGTLNGHAAIIQHAQVAVAHPDGSHRLAQPVISTEAWMEDVGKGTLTNGQANIGIAPEFAALADVSDYHVFLTAHGNYHLHVVEMKPDGFVARVTDVGNGTQPTGGGVAPGSQVAKASNVAGTFSWRMMAKRKDGQTARLATYTFPTMAAPRISEPPTTAQPQTKPVC